MNDNEKIKLINKIGRSQPQKWQRYSFHCFKRNKKPTLVVIKSCLSDDLATVNFSQLLCKNRNPFRNVRWDKMSDEFIKKYYSLKYKGSSRREIHYKLYAILQKRQLIDDLIPPRRIKKADLREIKKAALKCKNLKEFKSRFSNHYWSAQSHGIYKEVTKHMEKSQVAYHEIKLQNRIENWLVKNEVNFIREFRLSNSSIPDFLIKKDNKKYIIEVKSENSRWCMKEIISQLKRYDKESSLKTKVLLVSEGGKWAPPGFKSYALKNFKEFVLELIGKPK